MTVGATIALDMVLYKESCIWLNELEESQLGSMITSSS